MAWLVNGMKKDALRVKTKHVYNRSLPSSPQPSTLRREEMTFSALSSERMRRAWVGGAKFIKHIKARKNHRKPRKGIAAESSTHSLPVMQLNSTLMLKGIRNLPSSMQQIGIKFYMKRRTLSKPTQDEGKFSALPSPRRSNFPPLESRERARGERSDSLQHDFPLLPMLRKEKKRKIDKKRKILESLLVSSAIIEIKLNQTIRDSIMLDANRRQCCK